MQHPRLYPQFSICCPGEHGLTLAFDRHRETTPINTSGCHGHLRHTLLCDGMILGGLSLQSKQTCRLSVTSRGLRVYTSGLFLISPLSQGCQLLSDTSSPLTLNLVSSAMLQSSSPTLSLTLPSNSHINLIYYSIPNKTLCELLSATHSYGHICSFLKREEGKRAWQFSSLVTPEIRELLLTIRHCRYEGPAKNLYLQGLLLELLALQLTFLERRKKRREETHLSHREVAQVSKICRYLTLHIDEPPTLDELAHMASMNRNKLNAAFHELLGMSVFQWLRNERLVQARVRLQHSNAPLTEIADMLGYSSSSNFSHAFKKSYGISPKQYRQQRAGVPIEGRDDRAGKT